MGNIFKFIEKYHFFLLFLLFEFFSFYLIINYNQTQKEIFLNSSNRFASIFLEISGGVKGYFSLKKTNDELSRENAYLRTMIPEQMIYLDEHANSNFGLQDSTPYVYIPAKVINNSINQPNNYLTLDKGSLHNINQGNGVISARGVVGIVSHISPHHSVVISLLNPKFRISAKLRNSDYFGSLVWDGKSFQHAILSEIPDHVLVQTGEAIVTSGYSAIFPEGILIGTVDSYEKGKSLGFYDIKVKLSVDFKNIKYVQTVEKRTAKEQYELEKQASDD